MSDHLELLDLVLKQLEAAELPEAFRQHIVTDEYGRTCIPGRIAEELRRLFADEWADWREVRTP